LRRGWGCRGLGGCGAARWFSPCAAIFPRPGWSGPVVARALGTGRALLSPRLGGGLAESLELLAQVHQGHDAGAFFTAEEDPLAENVDGNDPFLAAVGAQRLSLLGKALARGDIELMLILEAAEQPAASAGNLGRIE
jgi:hypothetical protein